MKMLRMSEEQHKLYQARQQGKVKVGVLLQGKPPIVFQEEKKPKYKNEKVVQDGKTYASKKEATRALELKTLEKAGEIQDLEEQVTYRLEVNGQLICKYIADFAYNDLRTGMQVVEDVKSEYTKRLPVYRIKAKLFKALYGFGITEV